MPQYTYRGHKSKTFYPADVNELVEIRARQRTFDGAYGRTAIGNLGYSLTILKLFDRRFYRTLLFVLSFFRSRHAKHDFADDSPALGSSHRRRPSEPIMTKGNENKPMLGKPFRTAGWIVVAVTGVVVVVEVGLLLLVLQL
ncbi:hypothetical protein PUNSTDRAFT_47068 [Punctularia strigosozonata HHB-11173 SS5]|uniref:Uncharacterized protein n=1 Tax=Punctularia strigosozonata (strain HHB-11173) TaxID=741275 RepID=R7S4H1_PUNST|nr:uncharacterized protein PUNSTDRAFT_47068 [Punctularia strigosozonata HHB-11173 SS5]EIN05275.1 hypothetical protein PUNSTDRAFT_47068 [Punctularia strigosozonata HHB-11173 SS5]